MKQITALLLAMALLCLCAACGQKQEEPKRSSREIIEEMVVDYGSYGEKAEKRVSELLDELKKTDEDAHARWERIMPMWKSVNTDLALNYDVLPDGLNDTDALAIVVLGFQLNPDGTMREELIQRLTVAKRCAEKYPNALIVCTGGGTASGNKDATEAGRMGEWLIENGVAAERVLVEDQSLTTAQNAVYSLNLLAAHHPQVKEIAIVSSDYHIATGTLLFDAESILRAEKPGKEPVKVVSNAAWKAPSGSLSTSFQAGALIELSGDTDTAFDIYYDTYDIHSLPPLE
jgi:uncharacterized SAM-binding protein YcdF (DUF218 family)